jgi:hypothetical protein
MEANPTAENYLIPSTPTRREFICGTLLTVIAPALTLLCLSPQAEAALKGGDPPPPGRAL